MHAAIRSALVFNMKAIIAQKLLPSIKPGVGRVPTCEIMTFSPTVRKLLLEGQDDKLADAIRIGKDEGMQDFTMSLQRPGASGDMIDPADGVRGGPQPRSAENGAEGHRDERIRDAVMRRWLLLPLDGGGLRAGQFLAAHGRKAPPGRRTALRNGWRGPGGLPQLDQDPRLLAGLSGLGAAPPTGSAATPRSTALNYLRWNPIVFGTFAGALLLHWLLPWFWLGFPLLVIAYVAPLATYIIVRNRKVDNNERVLHARASPLLVRRARQARGDEDRRGEDRIPTRPARR